MTIPANAKPGDIMLVEMGSDVGRLIRVLQILNGDGFADYEHAALYVGNGKLLEAPGGSLGISEHPATEYAPSRVYWSSGILNPTDAQRAAIVKAGYGYLGVKYSYVDYAALVARHFRLPIPGLKSYVASSKHMICSQFVAQTYADAGCPLYDTWTGYVTPGDIWQVLESKKAH